MMPGPQLPDPSTEQGKSQLAFSMLTCAQQIDSEDLRLHEAHPAAARADPRRAEADRRHVLAFRARRHAPPGMLQNLVTMETFSIRGGLIHHVEAAPFVTIPYGLGNGWTPGSGR